MTATRRGLVLVTAALALGGCSVTLVPTDGSDAVATEPADPVTRVETAPPPSPDDPPRTTTDEQGLRQQQAAYADQVTQRLGCQGGAVDLTRAGEVVQLDGPCATVRVTAASVVVLAGEIGSLEIHGAATVVLASSIDTVLMDSSANEVSWVGAQPAITDSGAGNVTAQITQE